MPIAPDSRSNPKNDRASQILRSAIIFDCDGVLNEEPGGHGVLHADDVRLLPEAGEAVKAASDAGCLTVIITNRAQLARGLISFAGLDAIFARLKALFAEKGGAIDRIYFCPHHPAPETLTARPELAIPCECRKPGALLFRRAIAELQIDTERCAVIGDSLRDIGAGRAVGIAAYGVRTGYGCRDADRYPGAAPMPDLMFADVGEAVDFCVSYRRLAEPVLAALPARSGNTPIIVGIMGLPCSGKTARAHALARTLSENGKRSLHLQLSERAGALSTLLAGLREGRRISMAELAEVASFPGNFDGHEPSDCAVIILDGNLAVHPSVRPFVDLLVCTEVSEPTQRARFSALQRWQGLAQAEIDALWVHRAREEWPGIQAQRDIADLLLVEGAGTD